MMDVTPYVEGMWRRMATREAADSEAKRRAREAVARVVAVLRRRSSVRRIYLYGSLAYHRFHEGSDIDLAVEGASREELDAVARAVEPGSPFPLDLRPFEHFSPSFQRLITEFGEPLYDRPCGAASPPG